MLYASFAFANTITKKQFTKLKSAQSLAMRMTCNARRGTPTNGLEVILDVPPIGIFFKAEAAKSAYRLIGTNDEVIAHKGHVNAGKPKLGKMGFLDIPRTKLKTNISGSKGTPLKSQKGGMT